LDISDFIDRFSELEWIDWKYYFISKIAINPHLSISFKQWYNNRIREIKSTRKKCLILDLDNTLWGGVLGEDGINGIKIGGDYPGNAYLLFQYGLLELGKNGIILTICSKNNETDVLEAWKKIHLILLQKGIQMLILLLL
jgi:predicted enzyme involved in methoxymalonyl-ACP biosynthesis